MKPRYFQARLAGMYTRAQLRRIVQARTRLIVNARSEIRDLRSMSQAPRSLEFERFLANLQALGDTQ
jgi:hypothetical protein